MKEDAVNKTKEAVQRYFDVLVKLEEHKISDKETPVRELIKELDLDEFKRFSKELKGIANLLKDSLKDLEEDTNN